MGPLGLDFYSILRGKGGVLFPILGQSRSYETDLEKEPHCGTELESVDQIFEARWVGHINRI